MDDQEVTAYPGETLWQVAKRAGEAIPHLCFKDAPGYRADGNCRACMVEVEGERVLAASCIREAKPGMVVRSAHSPRATQARETVLELLMADQPSRAQSPDRSSHFWEVADQLAVDEAAVKSWLPPRRKAAVSHAAAMPTVSQPDTSHPAMHVNLDACITCNLCVRACREVQSNDVIGMAQRG
ncbi:MAG TPA: formate dehydrogenase subunit alpha, partial [Halomonas sp.]|nr:formate dehydrogenase subunit alpha [Halomonas sp.]